MIMLMMDSAKLPILKMQNDLSHLFYDFSRCCKYTKCHCKWLNGKNQHLMANSCAVEATAVLPLGCLGNVTAKKHGASLDSFVSVWTNCRLWSAQL